MNSKIIAGSILAGFGILAQVLSEWLKHIFVALFYAGKGSMLQGGGSFTTPVPYTAFETIELFMGTQVVIALAIIGGFSLIAYGLYRKE